MGGTFLTNQLVGRSAFQGRRESLRASHLRKTDNRIGKEGERGAREAAKKNRKLSFQDRQCYRTSTGLDEESKDFISGPGPGWVCRGSSLNFGYLIAFPIRVKSNNTGKCLGSCGVLCKSKELLRIFR